MCHMHQCVKRILAWIFIFRFCDFWGVTLSACCKEATLSSSTWAGHNVYDRSKNARCCYQGWRRLLQGCQQTLRYSHKSKEKHWVNPLFWLIGWQLIKIGIIWAVGSPPFEWQSESKLRERLGWARRALTSPLSNLPQDSHPLSVTTHVTESWSEK